VNFAHLYRNYLLKLFLALSRRYENIVTDRKAFRLFIHDDDRDKLLNEAARPDSVMVAR